MTFKEYIRDLSGYETMTTFWEDFSIADKFGISAVKDTYNRAFNEWKGNYKYLTELVLVLNHKIWQHYEKNDALANVYNDLLKKTEDYAYNNLEGEQLQYYIRTLD